MSRFSSAAKMAYRNVSHVIFDMDGLLLDTECLYTEAINNIIGQYGKEFSWDVKLKMMGMTGVDAAKLIVKTYDLPITWEEYIKLAREEYAKLMPNANLMPDTEGIYKRVVADIAKSFGKKYPLEVRLKVLGRTEQDTFKIAVKDLKLPITTEEFAHEYRKLLITKLPTAPLMPGAENLVRHLHKNNIPIAVATSSSQDTVELKTRKHKEIFSLFNHIVMGSSDPDVKHGKPAPDIFLVTAARFPDKPSPEKCLVFEDAPNGVDGAVAAGMQCVMVPDPHVTPELREKATLLLESLIEFKPQDFGLPAF